MWPNKKHVLEFFKKDPWPVRLIVAMLPGIFLVLIWYR